MKFLFRADATQETGTGHVMRCIALAQACVSVGDKAIFALVAANPLLEERLKIEGIEVFYLSQQIGSIEDANATGELALKLGASWVILDGYSFDAEYQKIIKNSGLSLLFIDDYGHANHYWADVILNQNVYAHERFYQSREPSAELLLGSDYMLLRKEFWQWRKWKRETLPIACKLLVTMGGSDPYNVTLKVIQALQLVRTKVMDTVVIAGSSNSHYEELVCNIKNLPFSISLQKNVRNMPELMAWADFAVTAGGSTTWEMAFMGLPCLALSVVESQRQNLEKLDNMEIIENLGWYEDVSVQELAEALSKLMTADQKRLQMTKRGQKLVDGQGTIRVLKQIFYR